MFAYYNICAIRTHRYKLYIGEKEYIGRGRHCSRWKYYNRGLLLEKTTALTFQDSIVEQTIEEIYVLKVEAFSKLSSKR